MKTTNALIAIVAALAPHTLSAFAQTGGWGEPDWDLRPNVWPRTLQPACVPAPLGLVDWWPGEGTAQDIAGHNDGTLEGGVFFSAAKVGQGFTFDSNDDRVAIPHAPALDMQPAGFTVEFWMMGRKNQPQNGFTMVDKSHGYGTSLGWVFQGNSATGTIGWDVGTGLGHDDFVGVATSRDVLDGQFHHVAGTWEGTMLRFYVDGALEGSLPFTTPGNNNTLPLRLGFCWASGASIRFFRGVLDELSVYQRALSANEVAAIYAAGSAGKCLWSPEIRFTDVRLLGPDLGLTSTGRVQTGAAQIIQASTNPAIPDAWANVQTNPAPSSTNTWLVPREGERRFFRILERP